MKKKKKMKKKHNKQIVFQCFISLRLLAHTEIQRQPNLFTDKKFIVGNLGKGRQPGVLAHVYLPTNVRNVGIGNVTALLYIFCIGTDEDNGDDDDDDHSSLTRKWCTLTSSNVYGTTDESKSTIVAYIIVFSIYECVALCGATEQHQRRCTLSN